jgi:hypothetical protein
MKTHTKCVGQRTVGFFRMIHWMSLRGIYLIGKGFVHVATEAQVSIIPTFMANQEEMRWNPILYLWNLLGLGRLFSFIVKLGIPLLTPLLNFIGPSVWFSMTWFQIPIPAKLTLYIGDPVPYDMSKDNIDDVSGSLLPSLVYLSLSPFAGCQTMPWPFTIVNRPTSTTRKVLLECCQTTN